MKSLITIDGSMGEGGGQVLRTALALSLITGKPIRISNIRARRKRPGLLRQHLTALNAAAKVGRGRVSGADIGSMEVTFEPREVMPGSFHFSIGTAGSTTLVLQTVLPALMVASEPSQLVLEGGTHNPFAPPFDFLDRAFVPLIRRMGPEVSCNLERQGFYPAGGGRFSVTVTPVSELAGIILRERGEIKRYGCCAVVAQISKDIGYREVRTVCEEMDWPMNCSRVVYSRRSPGPGNVLSIEIEAENIAEVFTGFGMRGVSAEQVASGAAMEAGRYLKAGVPVGIHLADQILLPMAMAGSGSFRTLSPSQHTLTNIRVIESFLDVEIKCACIANDVWEISIMKKMDISRKVEP
jgi:RNA 3'-terminal phosphate cyclase (ATP)